MVAHQLMNPATDAVTSVSVDEAVALVAAAAPRTGTERMPLEGAVGRVLAADVASLGDLPNCDVSAMDGYACRAADTVRAREGAAVALRLVGESAAGRPYPGVVGAGEAVAIFTGAPLPDGADAVVRLEDARRERDTIALDAPASARDIRARADQLASGAVYLRAGATLSPRAVLLAAAMGHDTVTVSRQPRVAVVVTGDEVVDPGSALGRGQVFNANGPAVAALVAHFGGSVRQVRHAADDRDALMRHLDTLRERVDLIVTTGGAAAGRYDMVHTLLTDDPRGRAAFTRVRVRPGGPASFGFYGGVPLLALPGNPAAAAVIFQLLGAAWLYSALGRSDPAPYPARTAVRASAPFRHARHKTGLWPAVLAQHARDDLPGIEPAVGAGGGPGELGRATCLAVTAPWQDVPAGGRIEMMALA